VARENARGPVVALLGSEAPGRIAWALEQGAGAIIAKPLASSAVYPALVMALGIHQERKAVADKMKSGRARAPAAAGPCRRRAHHAERMVDEELAYTILRDCAMRRRMPMEQVAAFISVAPSPCRRPVDAHSEKHAASAVRAVRSC
jgi:AmiR/NasT family two-component response regulator